MHIPESRFVKNCFIFKYSARPGTAAIERFEDVQRIVRLDAGNPLQLVLRRAGGQQLTLAVTPRVNVIVDLVSLRADLSLRAAQAGDQLVYGHPSIVFLMGEICEAYLNR